MVLEEEKEGRVPAEGTVNAKARESMTLRSRDHRRSWRLNAAWSKRRVGER